MTRQSWARTGGGIVFDFGLATDSGPVRSLNEDAVFARPPVFLVADGMGGHSRGDQASATVARVFGAGPDRARPWSTTEVSTAIRVADDDIRALRPDGSSEQVGTTIAALVLVSIDDDATDAGLRWMVAHLGDSRVYRHDATGLERLTVDHSLVQELIDEGAIDQTAARRHPNRNVITRALGVNGPDAATLVLPASGEQCFLLCSDGVCGVLDDAQLARLMEENPDPQSAADAIVRAAFRAGGRDNATALVVTCSLPVVEMADVESTDTRPSGVSV
jgi:protein phosphatase